MGGEGTGIRMILQSMMLPDRICNESDLYFRANGNIRIMDGIIELSKKSRLKTNTYMNYFDAGVWNKYTGITKWAVRLNISGKGKFRLYCRMKWGENLIWSEQIDTEGFRDICIPFDNKDEEALYYCEIEAEEKVSVREIGYYTEKDSNKKVHIGVIICTYKRNQAIYNNLNTLKNSYFFDESSELYGKLSICIVDNASELPLIREPYITLCHNPNTGGSGGFTRGILETRAEETKYGITNVVFMDDDVEVFEETFYRLYALLTLLKQEYHSEVVAGRMFRLDRRWMQFTAVEEWNGGYIHHICGNQDMRAEENLYHMNRSQGEYAGWWFGCYPMEFVRENLPVPFFLHCDDVEYGLRHGGKPIVLNGIQVWHETYEYRQSSIVAYYDMRNMAIVNEIIGYPNLREHLEHIWTDNLEESRRTGDSDREYMQLLGIRDYCRGISWLYKLDAEKWHRKLSGKSGRGRKWGVHFWTALNERFNHVALKESER